MAETKHTISTKLHIDASLRLAASSPAQSGPGDVTGFAMTPCGGSEADADGDGVGADGFLIVLRHAEEGASQPSLLRFLRLTHTPGVLVCVGNTSSRRHVTQRGTYDNVTYAYDDVTYACDDVTR